MNKIRKNALRIAELMGYEQHPEIPYVFIMQEEEWHKPEILDEFSSYEYLLPLVLECAFSGLIDFEIFSADKKIFVEISECGAVKGKNPIKTEEEFIKEIQLLIIQYLKLKNGK